MSLTSLKLIARSRSRRACPIDLQPLEATPLLYRDQSPEPPTEPWILVQPRDSGVGWKFLERPVNGRPGSEKGRLLSKVPFVYILY